MLPRICPMKILEKRHHTGFRLTPPPSPQLCHFVLPIRFALAARAGVGNFCYISGKKRRVATTEAELKRVWLKMGIQMERARS